MREAGFFCEHCGARMETDALYCELCGSSAGSVESAGSPCCPKCMQPDQTISAEAFSALDLSETPSEKDKLDAEIAQQYLARPEMPRPPSRTLWAILPFIPFLNAIAIWFAPIHKTYKFVMLGFAAIFIYCVAVPELYDQNDFVWPGFALLAVYYGGLIFDRKRKSAEVQEKLLPEYRRMSANWGHLQYCRRCEAAWLSGNPSNNVHVENAEQLLKTG